MRKNRDPGNWLRCFFKTFNKSNLRKLQHGNADKNCNLRYFKRQLDFRQLGDLFGRRGLQTGRN